MAVDAFLHDWGSGVLYSFPLFSSTDAPNTPPPRRGHPDYTTVASPGMVPATPGACDRLPQASPDFPFPPDPGGAIHPLQPAVGHMAPWPPALTFRICLRTIGSGIDLGTR